MKCPGCGGRMRNDRSVCCYCAPDTAGTGGGLAKPLVLDGPIQQWQQRVVSGCARCPFTRFEGYHDPTCAVGGDFASLPRVGDPAPDWCQLRLGPVVVSLAPSEEE